MKINIAVYSHMRFNMSIICLFLIKLVIFVLLSILYTLSGTIKGRPGLISHFFHFRNMPLDLPKKYVL